LVPVSAHDYESAGKPLIAWDDPVAKAALVDALVNDALALLAPFEDESEGPEATSALGLLALVAGQDVEQDDDGTWKIAQRVAPDRIISTVDPEARHMHESRSEYRDGYKAHIAIEPETGLVTATALTPANTPDGSTGVELLAGQEPGLQVIGDGAYGTGEALAALGKAKHHPAIKPFPIHSAIKGGFDLDDFAVDEQASAVICPAGHVVAITKTRLAVFGARCRNCSLKGRCMKSIKGRQLTLTAHDAELVESRRPWREGDFQEDYRRWRPMVERSIAWLVADNNGGSDSAVSKGINWDFRCASPPSISDEWSTLDSSTTGSGGSDPADPGRASPGRQMWDLTSGTAHPG
jgi:Transposase DDE domain